MRILVAIANHGTKNARFLNRLLAEYRSLKKYQVDFVVLSNVEKELGPDVEVVVGTPIKDPWSLPFGHKRLFAERAEGYDLFIYTEDDTLISERHIDAFLSATAVLPAGFIAGFLRYEVGANGTEYYSTMHGHYHWDPNSVFRAGGSTFASYSNMHSACFILTRPQLKSAIASGGFLLPPRKGRYDMLVTAATDPYTQCGLQKVIGISKMEDFTLHHLPNVYCGKIGMEAGEAEREIRYLLSLPESSAVRGPLFEPSPRVEDATWDKQYYVPDQEEVVAAVPAGVRKVLSVGCGCGTTESALIQRGMEVVGLPLDGVVGTTAAAKGIRVTEPDLAQASKALAGERFDCVLLMDVLHHFEKPVGLLRELLPLMKEQGVFVVRVPNCCHPSVMRSPALRKVLWHSLFQRDDFGHYGVHLAGRRRLASWLRQAGLKIHRWQRRSAGPFRLKHLAKRHVIALAGRS